MTTTDIASVDADGIVSIHGRADGAINRGGFKVLPERVRTALLAHRRCTTRCVVAVPTRQVGQSAVRRGRASPGSTVTEEALKSAVRSPSTQAVPVAVAILDSCPNAAAMKVRLDA